MADNRHCTRGKILCRIGLGLPMADVFISYGSEDRDFARIVSYVLERYGYSVWWDRRLLGGQNFLDKIEQELKRARCVLVLLTEAAKQSEWVRFEAEVGRFLKKCVPLVMRTESYVPGFTLTDQILADNLHDLLSKVKLGGHEDVTLPPLREKGATIAAHPSFNHKYDEAAQISQIYELCKTDEMQKVIRSVARLVRRNPRPEVLARLHDFFLQKRLLVPVLAHPPAL
jgi:hypothetical protein